MISLDSFPGGSVANFEKLRSITASIEIAQLFRVKTVFFSQTKFAQSQRIITISR